MRVAYLVGTYPAVSHTFITREVTALRELGYEIHTFSVRRPPPGQLLTEEDRAQAASTPSIQPPDPRTVLEAHVRAALSAPARYIQTLLLALRLSPGGVRATTWHFFYFAEAIVLWHWLRRRGISHTHVHFANAASTIAMLWAYFAEGQKATWSFTMHGPTEFDDVSRFRLSEKIERARFVVCVSDYARSQLMKLTEPRRWSKLHVVRCGIDTTEFKPARRRAGESAGRMLTILCVGRMVPEKGQAILIDALSSLPVRTARRLQVIFAGDGPQRDDLQTRAAELEQLQIEFTGAVGHDRLVALYRGADIFCLPSLAEGLPVVLMEAMAIGLPVLSTHVMGIPEIVDDRRTGLLVAPGRADVLLAALRELIDDEQLRRSLGTAARKQVLSTYAIGRAGAALDRLYSGEIA